MNPTIHAILIHVIIPELAALFRREPGITDEQAIAAAEAAYQRVVTAGEAFLRSKGITGPIDALPDAGDGSMRRELAGAIFGCVLCIAGAQGQAPPVPPPAGAAVEKTPELTELQSLRIQNALLKANAEKQRYDKVMADLGALIRAEVAAFEKEHPGWSWDAQKGVVKKPPPKG